MFDESGDVPHAQQDTLENTAGRNSPGTILVPTDFRDEADYALQHAIRLAAAAGVGVILFHVLEDDETAAQAQLALQAQNRRANQCAFPVTLLVGQGELPEAVLEVADRYSARYILLGTHSIQNPATLKSSATRRILKRGNVPFITIQQPPREEAIEHVVFPIDYTDGNRLKYGWLETLWREYNPTFHLVTPEENEPALRQSVQENMARAMALIGRLGAKHIQYQVEGKDEFSVEILEYALSVEADLLVITSAPDPRQPGTYMLEPHERNLVIGGDFTPVMIINPKETDLC